MISSKERRGRGMEKRRTHCVVSGGGEGEVGENRSEDQTRKGRDFFRWLRAGAFLYQRGGIRGV